MSAPPSCTHCLQDLEVSLRGYAEVHAALASILYVERPALLEVAEQQWVRGRGGGWESRGRAQATTFASVDKSPVTQQLQQASQASKPFLCAVRHHRRLPWSSTSSLRMRGGCSSTSTGRRG